MSKFIDFDPKTQSAVAAQDTEHRIIPFAERRVAAIKYLVWSAMKLKTQREEKRVYCNPANTKSYSEMILEVAREFRAPFTKPDLVVACWKKYPGSFSLHGYPEPDSNRVYAKLSGPKGLMARNLILRADDLHLIAPW